MPYHPFFDAMMYPWPREDAQAFHVALYRVVDKPAAIDLLYQQCGAAQPLTPGLRADLAWKEALDNLVKERRLAELCRLVMEQAAYAAAQEAASAIRQARDIIIQPVLPGDTVFLDRKKLREELEILSRPGGSGVLLVRGESGSGKSWTQELIRTLANDRGVDNLYLYEGQVSNVREVVGHLFAAMGDLASVPPTNETDPAWYRRVCLKLQELAQNKNKFLWVVADDLGEYNGVPRVDREIRLFFEQFALSLANPLFARWYRLVLIDYPDGPVPTKWRAWSEDRPNPAEVDEEVISGFLLQFAASRNKQLGADRAKQLAAQILANVAVPPLNAGEGRLRRVNTELKSVLKAL